MKIVVVGNYAEFLFNFRGALLARLVFLGHDVVACAPGDNSILADQLAGIGVTYRSFPLERTGLNPFKDFRTFRALFNLFREIKPDVVLAYTVKPVVYGSLAARLAGVGNICSMITGLGYAFFGDSFKQHCVFQAVRILYWTGLRCNSAVLFQNPDDLELFSSLGLVSKKVKSVLINGSGVDTDYYQFTSQNKQVPVFLMIARLIREKGIIEFVEAARILKRQYPETIFRLVGPYYDGPTAITEEQVKEWTQEGIIEYLGATSDVRPYIESTSVFVLPSYREGTPRTVLEAMSMGRPVVTTDVPGCRETVVDGENGFLVPPRDPRALADAMERFIASPALIEEMGVRARDIAVKRFDVHEVNRVIIRAIGLTNEAVL